jgi:nitrite reductase/ring-hydroxylating ferredoxin subunit
MAFVVLEMLHQLYDGYRRVFRVGGRELLLIQEEGRAVLINNSCPHAGAALVNASCVDNALRCPRHGISFDLATGRARDGACSDGLIFVPIIYEGNRLGVELKEGL